MTSKSATTPLKQLSPATSADNLCAVCGKFVKPSSGYARTSCQHIMHTACMVNLSHQTRSDGETRCTHCDTVLFNYNTDSTDGNVEEQDTADVDDALDVDCHEDEHQEDDADAEVTPSSAAADIFATNAVQSVMMDRKNTISRAFALEHDLEWMRTSERPFARTYADLRKLGFTAEHLAIEVNGKKMAPLSQLLDYSTEEQPVTMKLLEASLGVTLNDVLKLNPSPDELARLGVDVVFEGDAGGEAAPAETDKDSGAVNDLPVPKRRPANPETQAAIKLAEDEFRARLAQRYNNRSKGIATANIARDTNAQKCCEVVDADEQEALDTDATFDSDYDADGTDAAVDDDDSVPIDEEVYVEPYDVEGEYASDNDDYEAAPTRRVMYKAAVKSAIYVQGREIASPNTVSTTPASTDARTSEARKHQQLREQLNSSSSAAVATPNTAGSFDMQAFERHLKGVRV